ncbi:MAG: hypothetical protein AAF385_02720 [Pseudomonadota bacterium]
MLVDLKIKAALATAIASLTVCSSVIASSTFSGGVVRACLAEYDNKNACRCSVVRLTALIGNDDFQRYDVFFHQFSQAHANAGPDRALVGVWNTAMERYARLAGEDRLEVMGFIPTVERLHRYALSACGIKHEPNTKSFSLFFFGEAQ